MTSIRTALSPFALAALLAVGCSSGSGSVATVDGVEIPESRLDELHVTIDEVGDDELVGSVLLLVMQEAFYDRADVELGISPTDGSIDAAVESQRGGLEGERLAAALSARNETESRLLVNARLDAIRDLVATHLVTAESEGFDLAAAELAFRLANTEICIRQIQLADEGAVAATLDRLAGGQAFAEVARDVSIDPFVSRDDGVGAGGDLGCSAPAALPPGLAEASLDVPLDQPTGPVASSVGVHVVEVYERTEPDLTARHDEVVEAAIDVQGPVLFREWAVDVLRAIDVEVDDSIGRWAVLPETDPVPTVVPPHRFTDIITN